MDRTYLLNIKNICKFFISECGLCYFYKIIGLNIIYKILT